MSLLIIILIILLSVSVITTVVSAIVAAVKNGSLPTIPPDIINLPPQPQPVPVTTKPVINSTTSSPQITNAPTHTPIVSQAPVITTAPFVVPLQSLYSPLGCSSFQYSNNINVKNFCDSIPSMTQSQLQQISPNTLAYFLLPFDIANMYISNNMNISSNLTSYQLSTYYSLIGQGSTQPPIISQTSPPKPTFIPGQNIIFSAGYGGQSGSPISPLASENMNSGGGGGGGAGGLVIYLSSGDNVNIPSGVSGINASYGYGGFGGYGFGAGNGGNAGASSSYSSAAQGFVYILDDNALFTSTQSYIVSSNHSFITVILMGAGGLGGTTISNIANNGGCSGNIVLTTIPSYPGLNILVTVGAGFLPSSTGVSYVGAYSSISGSGITTVTAYGGFSGDLLHTTVLTTDSTSVTMLSQSNNTLQESSTNPGASIGAPYTISIQPTPSFGSRISQVMINNLNNAYQMMTMTTQTPKPVHSLAPLIPMTLPPLITPTIMTQSPGSGIKVITFTQPANEYFFCNQLCSSTVFYEDQFEIGQIGVMGLLTGNITFQCMIVPAQIFTGVTNYSFGMTLYINGGPGAFIDLGYTSGTYINGISSLYVYTLPAPSDTYIYQGATVNLEVSCQTAKIYNSVLTLNVLPELVTNAPIPMALFPTIPGEAFTVQFINGSQIKTVNLLSNPPLNATTFLMYILTFTGIFCSDIPISPDYNLGFMPTTINILNNTIGYSPVIQYMGNYIPSQSLTSALCYGIGSLITVDTYGGNYTNIQNQITQNINGTPFTPVMLAIILL